MSKKIPSLLAAAVISVAIAGSARAQVPDLPSLPVVPDLSGFALVPGVPTLPGSPDAFELVGQFADTQDFLNSADLQLLDLAPDPPSLDPLPGIDPGDVRLPSLPAVQAPEDVIPSVGESPDVIFAILPID